MVHRFVQIWNRVLAVVSAGRLENRPWSIIISLIWTRCAQEIHNFRSSRRVVYLTGYILVTVTLDIDDKDEANDIIIGFKNIILRKFSKSFDVSFFWRSKTSFSSCSTAVFLATRRSAPIVKTLSSSFFQSSRWEKLWGFLSGLAAISKRCRSPEINKLLLPIRAMSWRNNS